MTTNHPVRFIGRHPFRKLPILSLAFIQARARADMEIDLASLPPLISGGDRKARSKAINEQRSSLRAPRRVDHNPWIPAYGQIACTCPHCQRLMLLDEVDIRDQVTCDRCKRAF